MSKGSAKCALQILEAASKLGDSGWEYAMEASFIEVYNETLRDLLAEGRTPREAGRVLDNNAIKHMADGMPYLPTHIVTTSLLNHLSNNQLPSCLCAVHYEALVWVHDEDNAFQIYIEHMYKQIFLSETNIDGQVPQCTEICTPAHSFKSINICNHVLA